MKIAIIANKKSNNGIAALDKNNLDLLAEKYNLSYELYILDPQNMESILNELAAKSFSYNAFLIAGGDGTVRTAVQALINQETPLAILPLGTFNMFAKELNFPADIDTLFNIIKNNKTKQVDVGEVNNYVFINHSAIGFYSHILKLRKKRKKALGKSRLLKILFTGLNIFKVLPIYKITLTIDDKMVCYNTFLTVIGNNYHFTNLLNFGSRNLLTTGKLSIYILQGNTRWEFVKCISSILFNTANKQKYLTEYSTDNALISSESKWINVDIDGELFKLEAPLRYTIYNKKLTVMVP